MKGIGMIYLGILAVGVVGFLGTALTGFATTAVWFLLGTPAILLLAWLIHIGNEAERFRQERIDVSKNVYDLALKMLALKPNDPDIRVKCLEDGRAYYQLIIPNTQTMQGTRVIFTADNSANREARIQADINARIGHLKAS